MVEPHCVERREAGVRASWRELTEHELRTKILRGAMAYGFETDLWTVNRLRRVIFDEFRIRLSKNTIWRRLRDAGLTYQKPEREYYEIDEATRKKWLRYEVPKIRRAVKKHRAILPKKNVPSGLTENELRTISFAHGRWIAFDSNGS